MYQSCTLGPLKQSDRIMHGPGQSTLDVKGYFTGELEKDDTKVKRYVYVVHDLQTALLGRPAIEALQLLARINRAQHMFMETQCSVYINANNCRPDSNNKYHSVGMSQELRDLPRQSSRALYREGEGEADRENDGKITSGIATDRRREEWRMLVARSCGAPMVPKTMG